VYDVVVEQLLGLPRFQNLLLLVYDHIKTRQLVVEGVWVVGRQNADIADTLHLRDFAMAAIFERKGKK